MVTIPHFMYYRAPLHMLVPVPYTTAFPSFSLLFVLFLVLGCLSETRCRCGYQETVAESLGLLELA